MKIDMQEKDLDKLVPSKRKDLGGKGPMICATRLKRKQIQDINGRIRVRVG